MVRARARGWLVSPARVRCSSSMMASGSRVAKLEIEIKELTRRRLPVSLQAINYTHLMPTRYALDLEALKGSVTVETFKEPSQREDSKKAIKKILEERYTSGKNRWVGRF